MSKIRNDQEEESFENIKFLAISIPNRAIDFIFKNLYFNKENNMKIFNLIENIIIREST